MSNTRESVEAMINQYVAEVGLSIDQTYNAKNRAWYWMKGSAKIEVFVQEIPMGTYSRFFLRVFSPIFKVPAGKESVVYKKLLELNDKYLGLKLTLMPNSTQIYATFERDIQGMDYNELATTIADLEWWADKLDDELMQEFGTDYISDRR
ncbi:MAG: YbjN domain-containing protein [Cytophagaceae bacterium]|jgi:hypothetical protein|nr:YbjN domain-containing protein [Cytophagaceae bacterium]